MLGNNKALKKDFQDRKLEATLAHIIDVPYDGVVLATTTRGATEQELRRIYTHLWWMEEGPVKAKKSNLKKKA